ncbi:hypothetical protein [Dubosiella muris]|uniref:Uncharacterized protein n=1 Tax=Dubosiella muris TaxID=3038133 RepID=A0AC61R9L4_9FIRM|nr:hypothetical protein [Dubosiella muris]TGY66704.1 hypothetical protein E5336_02625 [Dubosiella muris]
MSENMKIYDDSFELEGVTYSLNAIKKVTILNEDAKYKGKTKPFTHQVLSGVTMLMPIAGNPALYVGLRIVLNDDSMQHVYVSQKPVQINSEAYFADRKEAEKLMEQLTKDAPSSVLRVEKNDPIL